MVPEGQTTVVRNHSSPQVSQQQPFKLVFQKQAGGPSSPGPSVGRVETTRQSLGCLNQGRPQARDQDFQEKNLF